MAQFPPIQFKRSAVLGSVPTAAQLLVGEIAINLEDRKIYTKTDQGEIIVIGANYDSEIEISDSDIRMAIHDYLEADSDIRSWIDSEIANRIHGDSELLVKLDSEIANRIHGDSEIFRHFDSELRNTKLTNIFDVRDPSAGTTVLDTSTIIVSGNSNGLDGTYTEYLHNMVAYYTTGGNVELRDDNDLTIDKPFWLNAAGDVAIFLFSDFSSGGNPGFKFINVTSADLVPSTVAGTVRPATVVVPGEVSPNVAYLDFPIIIPDIYPHGPIEANTGGGTGTAQSVTTGAHAPAAGDVLYRNDSELWDYSKLETKLDAFVATQDQTVFPLTLRVAGDVTFIRNGVVLDKAVYLDSEIGVVYDPAQNANNKMRAGDKVMIQYTTLNIQK